MRDRGLGRPTQDPVEPNQWYSECPTPLVSELLTELLLVLPRLPPAGAMAPKDSIWRLVWSCMKRE